MLRHRISAGLWALARRAPGSSISFGPVRRRCADVRSLTAQAGWVELRPATRAPRPTPISIYGADAWQSRRWQTSTMVTCPPADPAAAFLVTLPGGRVLGDDGAVVTREDALLTQVSVDLRVVNSGDEAGHTALHQWRLPPLRRLARRVAVLAVLGGHNYFHWMFHLLPRIALLRDAGIAFDEIDLFATNPVRQPFQEQTLARLGIPRDRVIEIGPTTHVSADELVVPSRPSRMSEVAGWVRDFLRDTFLDPASKPADTPDRIYLTRSGSGHRRLVNEPQVRRLVQKHGFTPVTAETMSVADQARLFAGASVVVAPHGAGLANLVFCRPGVTVVEIFSPRYINGCYWQLSAWTGARYHYVIGTGQEPTGAAPIFDQYGDIAVDLDDLSRTLRLAGI